MNNEVDNILKIKSYEIYIDGQIGSGQFGKIYQCKDNSNPQLKLCAKLIRDRLEDPKTKREIELMKMIMRCGKGNKNIVSVEYVEYNDDMIVLIMERCDSDLKKVMDQKKKKEQKYLTPNEALNVLKQIVNGYKVLYANNVIHRDLKPENILVLDGIYKVADLGLARVLEIIDMNKKNNPENELTKVGTPKYIAPEVYFDNYFSNQVDIFSLGIIIYELIFGELPYIARTIREIKIALKKLIDNPVKVNRKISGMTNEFALLIEYMLKYKESERISWEQLFKHPLILEESNVVINQTGFAKDIIDDQGEQQINEKIIPQPHQVSKLEKQQDSQTSNYPKKFQTFTPHSTFTPSPSFIIPAAAFNTHTFPQPFQFIQNIQTISDQLFQAGFFMGQILELLDKFINIQFQLRPQFFGFKLYLHYLAQCFFQHSMAMKIGPQNQFTPFYYSIQNVQYEILKQNTINQVITQEIQQFNLTIEYPPQPINLDYQTYLQKLNGVGQVKDVFLYGPDRKYLQEYLQLLYCLDRLNDKSIIEFSDIYNVISDINKNQKNEFVIRDYFNKKQKL